MLTVTQFKYDLMTDEEQTLHLDIDNNAKQAQSVIYQKMIKNKASDVATSNFTNQHKVIVFDLLTQGTLPGGS
jgi:hypothetical protein